jgi:hypothetical protein
MAGSAPRKVGVTVTALFDDGEINCAVVAIELHAPRRVSAGFAEHIEEIELPAESRLSGIIRSVVFAEELVTFHGRQCLVVTLPRKDRSKQVKRGTALGRVKIAEAEALAGMHEMGNVAPVLTLLVIEGEFELAPQLGTQDG